MIQTEKINPEEMKRSWHAQQEDILKDWSEQASCYRWMHERAYQVYKKQNMRHSNESEAPRKMSERGWEDETNTNSSIKSIHGMRIERAIECERERPLQRKGGTGRRMQGP